MQFQADILGVPVVRPKVTESTALGAAYLAGLAVGYWKKPQEIASQWQVEQRFEPKIKRTTASALRERWSKAVERAKDWEER
jgi:glycerol kinase